MLGELLQEVDERAGALAANERSGLEVFSLTKTYGLIPQTQRFAHRIATEDVTKYKVVRDGEIVYNPYVIWEGAIHGLRSASGALVSPVYVVWHTREADGGYLDFLLRTPELIESYQRLSSGAVNRRRSIRREGFLNIEVKVPPIEERRAIATTLRTVREANEACERVITATRQLKASLLAHLFTYGPVPLEDADRVLLRDSEIGRIPSRWEVARLRDLAQIVSGGTPSKSNPSFWNGTIPWVSPKDLKFPRLVDVEDYISEEGAKDGSRVVPAKAIFIVVRGMILARDIPISMGMVPMALNQDLKGIVAGARISPDYLLYALMFHKSQLIPHVGTSAHGTRRLSSSAVENLLIPIPSFLDQRRIASQLIAVDAKLASEEKRLVAFQELYKSLLHSLLTGSLRFPEFTNGS